MIGGGVSVIIWQPVGSTLFCDLPGEVTTCFLLWVEEKCKSGNRPDSRSRRGILQVGAGENDWKGEIEKSQSMFERTDKV